MVLRTHTIQAINPDELKLTITIKQNYLMNWIHAGPSYSSNISDLGVSYAASSSGFGSLGFCGTLNPSRSWGIYSFCLRGRCGAWSKKMRRIDLTSRGVQDYYILEYSYTAFRCGVTCSCMRRMSFRCLGLFWWSLDRDTSHVKCVMRRIWSRTSLIFFFDQSFICGAWYNYMRRILQSQAMVFEFI